MRTILLFCLLLAGCDNPITPERISEHLGCEVTEVRLGCWQTCPPPPGSFVLREVCP